MIIRNLKREDIQQLAELQCILDEYIDAIMDIKHLTKEKRISDIINYLEANINSENIKIIVAMENDKILSALRINFSNSCILISFLTNRINSKAINELLKKVQEIKKEKHINGEISCFSYDFVEIDKALKENSFICDTITFRSKLKNDVIIEDNKCIKKISKEDVKGLPKHIREWITEEDIRDKNKIILLYKNVKEIIVAERINKKELQIFGKPRPDNKNIEKQLIKQIQRIGIEMGIREFCHIETEIKRNKRGKTKYIIRFRI